ncbi:hypothetical protein B0H10DRAFT_1954971 [Mycena sp. CBHHK59/15]|nr:hypothetical protein B0H10DRAFT_1954971 [Mycena sp. CBHHK59/15]
MHKTLAEREHRVTTVQAVWARVSPEIPSGGKGLVIPHFLLVNALLDRDKWRRRKELFSTGSVRAFSAAPPRRKCMSRSVRSNAFTLYPAYSRCLDETEQERAIRWQDVKREKKGTTDAPGGSAAQHVGEAPPEREVHAREVQRELVRAAPERTFVKVELDGHGARLDAAPEDVGSKIIDQNGRDTARLVDAVAALELRRGAPAREELGTVIPDTRYHMGNGAGLWGPGLKQPPQTDHHNASRHAPTSQAEDPFEFLIPSSEAGSDYEVNPSSTRKRKEPVGGEKNAAWLQRARQGFKLKPPRKRCSAFASLIALHTNTPYMDSQTSTQDFVKGMNDAWIPPEEKEDLLSRCLRAEADRDKYRSELLLTLEELVEAEHNLAFWRSSGMAASSAV